MDISFDAPGVPTLLHFKTPPGELKRRREKITPGIHQYEWILALACFARGSVRGSHGGDSWRMQQKEVRCRKGEADQCLWWQSRTDSRTQGGHSTIGHDGPFEWRSLSRYKVKAELSSSTCFYGVVSTASDNTARCFMCRSHRVDIDYCCSSLFLAHVTPTPSWRPQLGASRQSVFPLPAPSGPYRALPPLLCLPQRVATKGSILDSVTRPH